MIKYYDFEKPIEEIDLKINKLESNKAEKNNNKIEDYTVRNPDSYWSNNILTDFETINHSNQNANWVEFLVGIKVETIKNIYFGISLRLNRLISNSSPNNFTNLYIPGFNKVTDDNSWGSGFNYTLTYSIPLKKRK